MKRNTALFGASLVAGVAAASGLIATSTTSSAAPGDTFYGVAWADATSGQSHGWTTGSYADPYGVEFSGTASAGSGTFKLDGDATISVKTTCVAGKPSVVVAGGGATGVHTGGSVSLAKFTGDANAIGTVTFASTKVAGHIAGAYVDLTAAYGGGTYVALAGADCAAAPTSTPPTTTPPTTTPPTSTSTTNPPTSTGTNPPTSTGTNPPSSTTTNPPTTAPTTPPPTTEPPTPTPTTTTLPVTG